MQKNFHLAHAYSHTYQIFYKTDLSIFIYDHILQREESSVVHSNGNFAGKLERLGRRLEKTYFISSKKKTFLLPLILTTDDLRHLARNSEYKYLGNVRSDDGDGYENVT